MLHQVLGRDDKLPRHATLFQKRWQVGVRQWFGFKGLRFASRSLFRTTWIPNGRDDACNGQTLYSWAESRLSSRNACIAIRGGEWPILSAGGSKSKKFEAENLLMKVIG